MIVAGGHDQNLNTRASGRAEGAPVACDQRILRILLNSTVTFIEMRDYFYLEIFGERVEQEDGPQPEDDVLRLLNDLFK